MSRVVRQRSIPINDLRLVCVLRRGSSLGEWKNQADAVSVSVLSSEDNVIRCGSFRVVSQSLFMTQSSVRQLAAPLVHRWR